MLFIRCGILCRTYVGGSIKGGIAAQQVSIVPIRYIIEKYNITLKKITKKITLFQDIHNLVL